MSIKYLKLQSSLLTIILVFVSFILNAQIQEGHSNENKFKQLYDQFADPNKYHNASGAPGVEYFQQKVDYVIDIELDDVRIS